MFRLQSFRFLALLAATLICSVSSAQPEGPVTIANGDVRLTVNPSAGRVVDFGSLGGVNLMRITDPSVLTDAKADVGGYQGYGGDQLWPAQQERWGDIRGFGGGWPPLNELDGPNWTIVDQSDVHITIESPEGPLLGLVARRRFEIDPDDALVKITNTFERVALPARVSRIPVQIWSVTGIVEPEFLLADVSPDRPLTETFVALNNNPAPLVTELADDLAIKFDNKGHGPGQSVGSSSMKLGMYGDWIAAVYDDEIFLQRSAYDVDGVFPDNAATEFWSDQNSGSEYVELEILSAATALEVGETLSNVVHWQLLDRMAGVSDVALVRQLDVVPEPASFLLCGCAALLMILQRKRMSTAINLLN